MKKQGLTLLGILILTGCLFRAHGQGQFGGGGGSAAGGPVTVNGLSTATGSAALDMGSAANTLSIIHQALSGTQAGFSVLPDAGTSTGPGEYLQTADANMAGPKWCFNGTANCLAIDKTGKITATGTATGAPVVLSGGGGAVTYTAATTLFNPVVGSWNGTTTTENLGEVPTPVSGTVCGIHVAISALPPYTLAYTLRTGTNATMVSSALTCTLPTSGNLYCDDTAHTVAITEGAGQVMDWQVVAGAGTAAARGVWATVKICGAN